MMTVLGTGEQTEMTGFEGPPAPERTHRRHAMQGTSLDAYYAADLKGNERTVWTYLVDCGVRGSTDDEGWRALGILKDTYAPSRNALMKKHRVVKATTSDGFGVRRKTPTGRSAIVWVAVEFRP